MPCRHWNSYWPGRNSGPAMAMIAATVCALWVANCGNTASGASSSNRAQAR